MDLTTPQQMELRIAKHNVINGIEMGVMENGIPYLTESGLAKMCGIDRSTLAKMAANWDNEQTKPRGKSILSLLKEHGYANTGLPH